MEGPKFKPAFLLTPSTPPQRGEFILVENAWNPSEKQTQLGVLLPAKQGQECTSVPLGDLVVMSSNLYFVCNLKF